MKKDFDKKSKTTDDIRGDRRQSDKEDNQGRNSSRNSKKYQSNNRRNNRNDRNSSNAQSRRASKPTNNPDHYTANPTLIDAAGRVSFTHAVGDRFQVFTPEVMDCLSAQGLVFQEFLDGNQSVPGVCVIDTVPSFGQSNDPSSAINVAANGYAIKLRTLNTGATKYDAPDIFTYYLAMSSCYSLINFAMRAYGTLNMYNAENKYLPDVLLRGMHLDPDDFRKNKTRFFGQLNLLIDRIAALAVPADMDFFKHVVTMYIDYYCEGDSIKDQIYYYNPMGFYRYVFEQSETPDHPEGYLRYYNMCGDGDSWGVDDLLQYITDTIDPIWAMQDLAIMSGDTVKTFGDNIIKLGTMPEDYRANIVYDPWVLNQIKNANIVGAFWQYSDLYQDDTKTFLKYNTSITVEKPSTASGFREFLSRYGYLGDHIISVPNAVAPDPKMVAEYSRLMVVANITQPDATHLHFEIETGADVVVRIRIIKRAWSSIDQSYHFNMVTRTSNWFNATAQRANELPFFFPFKFLPMQWAFVVNSDTQAAVYGGLYDYDNYDIMPKTTVAELHRVVMYNLLATKIVAKI